MKPTGSAMVIMPPAATATTVRSMTFDAAGADWANVTVLVGTHATSGTGLCNVDSLTFAESDTSTAVSNHTAIVALTGGTATGSAVGFVLPTTGETGSGAAIRFQIDLRKRKRYISMSLDSSLTNLVSIGAIVDLYKDQTADTAAQKATTNYDSTSANAAVLVVTA